MGNVCSCTNAENLDVEYERIIHEGTRKVNKKGHGKGSLQDHYKLGKVIGYGGFSVVKLAYEKESGKKWACKIISLPKKGQERNEFGLSREDILKEIDIFVSLDHPNIVYLKEAFIERNRVFAIMEHLSGGELLECIADKGHYTEDDARVIFKQLISGVDYLHSKGIAHRDLKLGNLLLAEKGNIETIKISDFGSSKKYSQSSLSTVCGTPRYIAPEIIKGINTEENIYGKECDVWSCGVILFLLLAGYPPFKGESTYKLYKRIKEGKYDTSDPIWEVISREAKELINKMLTVEPSDRITINGVLDHPWMNTNKRADASTRSLPETLQKMRTSIRRGALHNGELGLL